MKRFVLGMTALVCAVSMQSKKPLVSPEIDPSELDTLKSVELQGVQVTSTRASKKTPVAYTNMSKEELKAVNFGQDIPYLLSLTPSVTMTSDAGNGIGYTSLRVRGTDPSRINITANGIPVNDAESAQLYWVNMGGSYYSHKETLRFGTGLLKDHWGIQGRLSNIGSKGYLDRASTKLNSYFIQGGYFSDNTVVKFITWNGIEETYHAWNYTSKYEQSLYGRTYNSCGEYYDEQGNVHYYDGQTDNYHQQNYQLLWNQRLSRNLNLNVAGHYTKGKGYYEEYKTGRKLIEYLPNGYWFDSGFGGDKLKSDLIRQKKMDNDFFAVVASLMYNNHDNVEAVLGGGWNKYDGDHFGLVKWVKNVPQGLELLPDYEYYRNNAKKTDWNIYGKVNYEFVKGLNGFLDLQYRHIGYRMQDPGDWQGANPDGEYIINDDFNFFNPKFGLNYDITPHHKVYASYAIAHKEPTRNDYEDNIGTELKAERLNDLEAGYKFQSEKFSAGANLYWMSYRDQFVLTGELNSIGEAIAKNVGKSYRLGVELEAAWKPIDWFRWDANATFSKNRAENWEVTLMDGSVESLGDTPLSFSPDFIFNNIFNFQYKGMKASIQSQYVGDQYLTNTGFKSYQTLDDNGRPIDVGMMLDGHFTTNIDLSYTFSLKQFGVKDITAGISLYNIFSANFDNNGWAAPAFTKENGRLIATGWDTSDQYEAGFAPSAPFNAMAHLSINF